MNAANAVILVVGLATAACDLHHGGGKPQAEASDEWTRTYQLAPGGEVQIVNANGSIDVSGGPGSAVVVRAQRIVRAATEASAREIVPRVQIREDVTPEKVVIQTQGLSGLVIGVEVSVNYQITVPASASVRARSTEGTVSVTGITGRSTLTTANGKVVGRELGGAVDARSVNGDAAIDLAAFGSDPVEIRSINGSAEVTIPAAANANLLANVTNGKIDTTGLKLELAGDQTPRRLRGRLNAGGLPIEITSVNGNINIRPRQ